jgi:hypothetical protein
LSTADADKEAFARVLKALQPYADDLVFVGGWAHRLFPLHELARKPEFEPLMTDDADIATPSHLARGEKSIATLLKEEGFKETFLGDEEPPVTQYHLVDDEGGLYVEFLAPLVGNSRRRGGEQSFTTTIAGVTAQTLRHVDILIRDPWRVRISKASGFPVEADGVEVRIANAVSFLAQKLLVLPKRSQDKQPKDVLYIHDTLQIFSNALDHLNQIWKSMEPGLTPKTVLELKRRIAELFERVTDQARGAALIAKSTSRPNTPSADRLTSVCRLGLRSIFG